MGNGKDEDFLTEYLPVEGSLTASRDCYVTMLCLTISLMFLNSPGYEEPHTGARAGGELETKLQEGLTTN